MAYIWLLTVRPPALVGTYAYVNPVVAVFLGWLIADESISQQQIIALIVILAGVILVNFSKEQKIVTVSKVAA
jgi:drug/metabolite transporter (DMT)-like permease